MKTVWWRVPLRRLPELGFLGRFASFEEVDSYLPFLMEALDLPTGGRVLEVGCGTGGFCVRLAQWGYRVTGVEESEPMLALAREAAARRGVDPELRAGDLREVPERSAFDGALILDFGIFPDPENAAMMRSVAAALKPGARLVFGTCNPYYWSREPRTEHRVFEGIDLIQRHRFDFASGAVATRVRCILAAGERRDLPEVWHRAYTIPELRTLTAATGLADLRIYGEDEEGRPRPDRPLDSLATPFFHCVALRPVLGETGEGI